MINEKGIWKGSVLIGKEIHMLMSDLDVHWKLRFKTEWVGFFYQTKKIVNLYCRLVNSSYLILSEKTDTVAQI